jgi:WD40 repeat protein
MSCRNLAITLGIILLSVVFVSQRDVTSAQSIPVSEVIGIRNASHIEQRTILQGNTTWMSDLAFSPDGVVLAVAETGSPYNNFEDIQGKVRIWDTVTWEEKMTLSSKDLSAMSIAFNPDSTWLAVGNTTGEIQIWYWRLERVDAMLKDHSTWVNTIAFDPGDNFLASGSGHLFKQEGDYTVRLSLTGDWEEFSTLTPSDSTLGAGLSVNFSPNGGLIAAGMTNGTVHLWAVEGQQELAVLDEYAWADDLLFTPDGSQILFAANDGVRAWNLESAKQTSGNVPDYILIAPLQEKEFIFSVALSPDGTILAAGYQDGSVRLWSMDTGEQLTVLEGHEDRVVSLAFSPDGTLLASGGTDGTVRLWGVPGD